MASPHDSDDAWRSARLSDPTAVDPADPFDSTDRHDNVPSPRATQLTSDPPTALIRRDSFHELPPGCVVGENYEIEARLGAGAMGEVYAARHVRLGKRVAIKVISRRLSEDTAAIERFAMEARTLAQIQHPAIVAVEHVGELPDGRAYFVMEFLRGESLFERMQRGRLPLPEALRVLDQMARGLDAAHGEGVTHRDLKPENTFLVHLPGEAPTIKLVDFGLAKLAADRSDLDRRAERTQSGVAIGTPMYMSPEQARGPDVDYRTDIYALGCVAYELLLGAPPFPHAKTAPELYAAHLHEAPPLPREIWSEIDPQLDLVLFAMLAKDPKHRPTLTQFRSVIEAVRAGTAAQRAQTEFVGPRANNRARVAILITAIALIGGIVIGASAVSRTGSEPSRAPDAAPAPTPTPPPPAPPIAAPNTSVAAPSTPAVKPPIGPQPAPRANKQSASRQRVSAPPSIDAGIDSAAVETPARGPETSSDTTAPKIKPPVDRNQTINPFAKKHTP